ncbi:protein of unknown function [Malonomonas rubra DSM 5091]|uniref:PatA-like N-terminal domain-containing protein n=1 Tax=Malonomonas rubra DSM 5091 TaxID=1122189 RepID=A0A1M6J661_MALRU|nr:DUF4388 domain-containing protein [Malonomonas rubra]SHJ42131.1 protein of unknown function [Malonomonas rubra DSM 5091]
MSDLKIDADGHLKLPLAIRHQLGQEALQPVSSSPGHLLLGRPEKENPVLLAGLLGDISVPDLLSFFNMFRKNGILHFSLANGSKQIFFQQGEIVFASSTFANEDLGEILFSLGQVERDALLEIRQQVKGRVTLGKLLVDRGLVSPRQLWQATRSQVEGIVYSLFNEAGGSFHFESRALDQEEILRLSMSTQNLIMEGLRRQDEEALFMRKVISLDYFPVPTGNMQENLNQAENKLLHFAEAGKLPARDLFRKAGLREFDGIRTLYGLLERKLLQMEESPANEVEGELGEILTIYNNLFKILSRRMRKPVKDYHQQVEALLGELQQPYSFVMREVELLEDGTFDGNKLVNNLAGLEEGDRKKLLADSLCELAFQQTMLVRRELDADQARPLIARVQDTTTRVRALVER